MKQAISLLLLSVLHHVAAQSPGDIAKRICDRYIAQSNFELTEKLLDPIQQGILVVSPTEAHRGYEIETILTITEFGQRYLALGANPGAVKVWVNEELLFDGGLNTINTPERIGDRTFRYEVRTAIPPFPGDYSIRIHYLPAEDQASLYLWLTDEPGTVKEQRTFRADYDLIEVHPYKYRSLGSSGEWTYPVQTSAIQHESPLGMNDWQYHTGVTLDAMWHISNHFDYLDYRTFVAKHIDFFVENIEKVKSNKGVIDVPFHRYFTYQQLNDFGPQTVPFLHLKETAARKRFISKALNRVLYRVTRLEDGTFARYQPDSLTVWAEDLYMGTLLLSSAYTKTGDRKYLDEAVNQLILFRRALWDRSSGLYWHGYFASRKQAAGDKWAKANGFVLMAKLEILKALPQDHPEKRELIRLFREHAESIRPFQSLEGRWPVVLDQESMTFESSATAMFVTAFAEGVTNKWILFGSEEFKRSAISGWLAIIKQMDGEGNVDGIIGDTPILASDEEYNNLSPILNEPGGIGFILYACIAMDKLKPQ